MKRTYLLNDKKIDVEVTSLENDQVKFKYKGILYTVKNRGDFFEINDEVFKAQLSDNELSLDGRTISLSRDRVHRSSAKKLAGGDMLSPMPGKILKLCVAKGASFDVGDSLVIMEAMKMEHTIKATKAGVLTEFLFNEGQIVEGGIKLFNFEKSE